MNEFDHILNAEKQRSYRPDDPDLLAFAVMTQIAHEQAQHRLKRLFRIGLIISVVCAFAVIQMLSLGTLSFSGMVGSIGQFIEHHPFAMSIANLTLVSLLLLARRLRLL